MSGKISKEDGGYRLNFFLLTEEDFEMNDLPVPTPKQQEKIAELLQEFLMSNWSDYLNLAYRDVMEEEE